MKICYVKKDFSATFREDRNRLRAALEEKEDGAYRAEGRRWTEWNE